MTKLGAAAAALLIAASVSATAQPFEAGPPGTVVGTSMANPPLAGSRAALGPRVPNAPVFGDTVEERAWGRDFDGSHLRPRVPTARRDFDAAGAAMAGRPGIDPARAGVIARSGPTAIGRSEIARPSLGARRLR